MKRYELIKSVPAEKLSKLIDSGVISPKYIRYMQVHSAVETLLRKGVKKMDAYIQVGAKCYTDEDNVRKIYRYMCEEVE